MQTDVTSDEHLVNIYIDGELNNYTNIVIVIEKITEECFHPSHI